jgi:hypothetical protein
VKIYKPLRVSKGDVRCKKSTIATSTQIISITESFLKPLIQSHKRNGSKANPPVITEICRNDSTSEVDGHNGLFSNTHSVCDENPFLPYPFGMQRTCSNDSLLAEISNMYEVIVTISIARQIEFGIFC